MGEDKKEPPLIGHLTGALGGTSGVLAGHPLDTIKIRQQIKHEAVFRTVARTVNETFTKEGVRGFYKGLAFPFWTQGMLNSIFFSTYEMVEKRMNAGKQLGEHDVSYFTVGVAGGIGGGLQAFPCTLIEFAKIKLQNQTEKEKHNRRFKGPLHCVAEVAREHGATKCFRGLSPCIVRDVTGFAGYMLSFEYMCRLFDRRGPDHCSIPVQLLTGGLAGVFSWVINLPVDFIKSRLQADSLEKPRFRSSFHAAQTILKEEGARVFYRGLPAVLARAFVINSVTLTVVVRSRPYFRQLFDADD